VTARKLYDAGFTPLVSVVPPDARLAPTTGLKPEVRGKAPGKCRLDGCWVGYNFNADGEPTERDIVEWGRWGSNIGLQAANFPGLDVDVDDDELAERVVGLAREVLGPAPARTSRPPRRLLVYRTEEPFSRIAADVVQDGEEHGVEMLGEGRQYLVYGDHPSGNKYGWEDRPLWEWTPEELTEIGVEDVREFFSQLAENLHGRAEVSVQGTGEVKDESAPPQEQLEAPSMGELRSLVSRIPNRFPDRDDYVRVGCAIKAAGGEGAYPIFLDWAERWEEGDNDPETVEADWSRMHPPFRVGWEYLQGLAQEHGDYSPAEEMFEADEDVGKDMASTGPGEAGDVSGIIAHTDTWVVEQVAKRLKERARYVPESGKWHVWSERR